MRLNDGSPDPGSDGRRLLLLRGGTSAGFSRRRGFKIVGAVDLELAKPSGGRGASDCNATYQANHGIAPLNRDMMELTPEEFAGIVGIEPGRLNVMISCAPCTDLSRPNLPRKYQEGEDGPGTIHGHR